MRPRRGETDGGSGAQLPAAVFFEVQARGAPGAEPWFKKGQPPEARQGSIWRWLGQT
jgi:hypothetical protein